MLIFKLVWISIINNMFKKRKGFKEYRKWIKNKVNPYRKLKGLKPISRSDSKKAYDMLMKLKEETRNKNA